MSDNKETKQAPAVEAGARDQYFRAWMAVTEVLEEVAPDWHKEKGRGMDKACAAIRSLAALARASEAAAGEPVLPQGFSAKRIEGHGWVIDPPSGTRWVAYEGTPAGELMQALAAPQPVSEQQAARILFRAIKRLVHVLENLPDGPTDQRERLALVNAAKAILAAKGDGHAD